MRSVSWLNVALIGLVVLLAALLVDAHRGDREVRAAEVQGMSAGGVIAATGQYTQDGDVLYIVDTNQQTLLVYAYYRGTTSSTTKTTYQNGFLQLLAGRSYKWDTLAADKVMTIGKYEGAAPKDTRDEYLKYKDK